MTETQRDTPEEAGKPKRLKIGRGIQAALQRLRGWGQANQQNSQPGQEIIERRFGLAGHVQQVLDVMKATPMQYAEIDPYNHNTAETVQIRQGSINFGQLAAGISFADVMEGREPLVMADGVKCRVLSLGLLESTGHDAHTSFRIDMSVVPEGQASDNYHYALAVDGNSILSQHVKRGEKGTVHPVSNENGIDQPDLTALLNELPQALQVARRQANARME